MLLSVPSHHRVKQVALLAALASISLHATAEEGTPPVEVMLQAAEANFKPTGYARAKAMLDQAHSSYPNDGRVYFDYGILYAQQEHAKEAVAAFTAAIAKSPDLRDAYLNLALQNDVLQDYAASDAAYQKGTARFRKDVELWGEWGTTLILAHRFKDAERTLRHALTLKPKDPQMTADLAFSIVHQARPGEGAKLYEAAFAAGLKDSEIKRQYGDALAAAGELKRAEAVYTQLLASMPGDRALLYRRSKVRRTLGDAAGATADAEAMKK